MRLRTQQLMNCGRDRAACVSPTCYRHNAVFTATMIIFNLATVQLRFWQFKNRELDLIYKLCLYICVLFNSRLIGKLKKTYLVRSFTKCCSLLNASLKQAVKLWRKSDFYIHWRCDSELLPPPARWFSFTRPHPFHK